MKDLVIIGAGGHGHVVADIAKCTNRFSTISFLDDSDINQVGQYLVIGKTDSFAQKIKNSCFVVAIGNSEIRQKFQVLLEQQGATLETLIHPSATVSSETTIGLGSVVMAGAVINPNAKIGKGVIINTCSSVDHDCVVEDFSHVSVGSHIAGTVTIGKNCMIGAGATIINNVKICDNCIIGAGATVVNDITKPGTYVGTPAKLIKR